MNITIFITVLFVLQFVCLWAGRKASNNLKNQDDYFLAGRTVKFFPLLMTFVATQVGGGLVLGAAEEAYHYGWWVILYPLGACLGFVLLASGIGKKLAQFQVGTVAELFEVVYKSPLLKKGASLLSMTSLLMILIAQIVASKKFMMSIGFDQTQVFILFWALVIVYTVIGGLKAVVSIDIIQALFFSTIFFIGFGYILYYNPITFQELTTNQNQLVLGTGKLTGWLLMPLLFMVIEQDMAQRCFAAQSPGTVARAAKWSAILTFFICIIPVSIGIIGKSTGIEVVEGSSVFMTVVQALSSPALSAFIGCAVIMAIISTSISLLNAVSSNLTQDFSLNFLNRISSLQKSRWMTALIGVGALFGSFYFTNIVDVLIQSYELSVCCLFVPIFIALFKPHGNKLSASLSVIFGVVSFIIFRFVDVFIPKEIVILLISAFGFFLGEMIVSKKETDALEQQSL